MLALRDLLRATSLCVLTLAVAGCGVAPPTTGTGTGTTTTPPAVSGAPLAGDWLLVGSMPPFFTQAAGTPTNLALSITSSGSSLIGAATIQTNCAAGGGFGENFQSVLLGTVASDGSFNLSLPSGFTGQSFTITGTMPKTAGTAWTGQYSFTGTGQGAVCAVNLSNSFQATPVAGLSGTYQGQGQLVQFNGSLPTLPTVGANYGLTATLQQGTSASALAVAGSIQATGFPCFSKGQTSTMFPSLVQGNEIYAWFMMDDGSQLSILGAIANTADSQIAISFVSVESGKCAGDYIFNATPILMSH